MQEKILVGHKLRRLRQSMELSQTAMSEILDISPSYLNLLEHNQRPLTVALLLRLGNSFDIDLKEFAEDDSAALNTSITEIFADPLLAEERVPRREIQDMITAAPGAARAIYTLFQAYRKVRDEIEVTSADGRILTKVNSPVEYVRDFLQSQNNYFPALEEAAEDLCDKAGILFQGNSGEKAAMENPLSQYCKPYQQHRWSSRAGVASQSDA